MPSKQPNNSEQKHVCFNWDITLGNMLSICSVLVAAAMAWGAMSSRSTASYTKLETLGVKVQVLEITQARSEERLANILRTLQRIEKKLERPYDSEQEKQK